jgi:hypothetical protein
MMQTIQHRMFPSLAADFADAASAARDTTAAAGEARLNIA